MLNFDIQTSGDVSMVSMWFYNKYDDMKLLPGYLCLRHQSANNSNAKILIIRERRWSWRLIGVSFTTCESKSPVAKMTKRIIKNVLFSIAIFNGLILKIEK